MASRSAFIAKGDNQKPVGRVSVYWYSGGGESGCRPCMPVGSGGSGSGIVGQGTEDRLHSRPIASHSMVSSDQSIG